MKNIPKEEIEKLKAETEQQLIFAKKQVAFWNKKVDQLTGSLAVCKVLLKMAVKAGTEDSKKVKEDKEV